MPSSAGKPLTKPLDLMPERKVLPLDYMCLIRLEPVETKSKGGLILPEATVERRQWAGVRAVLVETGEHAFTDGDGEPWRVRPQPGDKVTIKQYGGEAIDASRDELLRLVTDKDILAIGWL
jgi:co-chaperonin GroES (HSP10)